MTGFKVFYEDRHIIVLEKPFGVASQTERGTAEDMVSLLTNYFYENENKHNTKGAPPYVGVVHRLDKNAGGIMVYGKNKNAAAGLSAQFSEGNVKKRYYAVSYNPEKLGESGVMTDRIISDKRTNTSRIAVESESALKEAKEARLNYRFIKLLNGQSDMALFEVELITGRHHQIRVQFAHRGCPLAGDRKYGPKENEGCKLRHLALYCCFLGFSHPATGRPMEFYNCPDHEIKM